MNKSNNKDWEDFIDKRIVRALRNIKGATFATLTASVPKTPASDLTAGLTRLLGSGEIVKTAYGGLTRYYLSNSGRYQTPVPAVQPNNVALPRCHVNAAMREPLPAGDAFLSPNYMSL